MIVALDVQYDDLAGTARAAAVGFAAWGDEVPAFEEAVIVAAVAPYEPGAFYRRELPCLLAVLAAVAGPVATVIVDGYVDLAPGRAGLGRHLYEALGERIPVVGVAKTRFFGADAAPVRRGESARPLWVTAAGMAVEDAAAHVAAMHGPHRIPTLLTRVDGLARGR